MEPKVDVLITELCATVEGLVEQSALLAGRVRSLQRRVEAGQETRPALQGMTLLARQAAQHAGTLDGRPVQDLLAELQQLVSAELIALERLGERRRRGLRVAPTPAEPAAAPARARPARLRAR